MSCKIKGFYKGFKSISHICAAKEREMEIENPTDVKHVAHIGCDHSSTTAPRVPVGYMNEFKTGLGETTKSFTGKTRVSHPTTLSTRSSHGIDQSMESEPATEMKRIRSCTDLPSVTMKRKRRKKSTCIAESSSTKSLRRLSKTKCYSACSMFYSSSSPSY
ncbi:CRIB domain-containing protein RIC10-like [Hibiscus syriacus]|uniref:CRIB domain-containing protein RIC10-like n=1 Tax=Hibiscus syriacus TaxID=106335 RepID=UPI0019224D29|nr:CRIB domain-containing protein RIC10-like [Hibiscus syriacus]